MISLVVASPLTGVFLAFSGPARIPILLALGFTALSLMPVLMAMMQEQFPENRALANGIFLGFSFVIQATATVILGMLSDHFGMRSAYIFAAVIPLIGLPLVRQLPKEERGAVG